MDTVAQIHSHLLAHQYEGLIKKAKLRGRSDADEPDPAGPARRRQGNPGEAARTDARPCAARRPATCCAPRSRSRQRRSASRSRRSWTPAQLVPDDIIIEMIAERISQPDCRQRLHPRRLSAHRAAGRGARPHAGERRAAARPRDRDEGRRRGAGRAHRRPLYLRQMRRQLSRPLQTADSRRGLRCLRLHRLHPPRRRQRRGGQTRLAAYRNQTAPILPYYRSRGSCGRSTAWPRSMW